MYCNKQNPYQQNRTQKLRDSVVRLEQREVLRSVFDGTSKNSSDKVSFSLLFQHFFWLIKINVHSTFIFMPWTSKRNEGNNSLLAWNSSSLDFLNFKLALISCMAFTSFSCEDLLEVPDISEQQIEVLAPLDGTTVTNNQVNFDWNALEDADGYRIQIATPNFDNASQFLLDNLSTRDSLGQLNTNLSLALLNGSYQWRIKGVNSGFETAFATQGFTVNGDPNADIVPPNTPELVAPTDGFSQDETNINFSWTREDVAGSAEKDSIYIYSDANLQNLELKDIGANKSYNTSLASNTYYWLVQAFDAAGNMSADSAVFELTIN